MFWHFFKREHGMSLIEVLGALTILSIVLTGLFSMFVQSASIENENEKQAVATHLARTVLDDLEFIDENKLGEQIYSQFNSVHFPNVPSVNTEGQFVTHPEIYLQLKTSPIEDGSLIKVTIEILDEHDELLTKTYAFLEVSNE